MTNPPEQNRFRTIDEVLRFAIDREVAAAELYTQLASRCESPLMRLTFLEFAGEERSHEAHLTHLLKRGLPLHLNHTPIDSLGISRHLPPIRPKADMKIQQALQFAMGEEKKAFRLYWKLAEATTEHPDIRSTFLALAQEEARHKLRFEIDYDNLLFSTNGAT